MDQFLEKYNLPKLIQEEIDNLNRFLSIKEIGINNEQPFKQKASGTNGFTSKFYQNLKKSCQLSVIFIRIQKQRKYFPTPFMKPASYQHQKTYKNITKKKSINQYIT